MKITRAFPPPTTDFLTALLKAVLAENSSAATLPFHLSGKWTFQKLSRFDALLKSLFEANSTTFYGE